MIAVQMNYANLSALRQMAEEVTDSHQKKCQCEKCKARLLIIAEHERQGMRIFHAHQNLRKAEEAIKAP